MTAVPLGTWPVGTPEWNLARRGRINGSEIAAVLGISPYSSPFSLWHRKTGQLGDIDDNPQMYWGRRLEEVILDEFALRHGQDFTVRPGGGLWRHHDRAWQGASPDGQVFLLNSDTPGPHELVEVKTARYDDQWGVPGTDEIPVHYRSQVLWYLDVFGLRRCHIAVLITGSDYREYVVEFDEAELVPMRAAARAFLDTIEANQPPPIDGHTATYEAVREMHPDIDPVTVELDAHLAIGYLEALAECKNAEAVKRAVSCEVIEAMGTAQHASYLGDRIATRRPPKRESEHPYLQAANGAADLMRSPV